MDQNIASSTINVNRSRKSSSPWIAIPARLWSATMLVLRKIYSSIQSLRNPLGPDVSAILNIDQISARLAVKNRAQFDGRNELPRTSEEVVTGTQKEVVVYFKDLQRRAQKQVSVSADRIRDFADDINLADAVANLNDIPSRCENELIRLSSEFQADLDIVRERELQHQRQYEEFRETNQLNRAAKYPISPGLPYSIMAIVIIAGTIVFHETLTILESDALVSTTWTFLTLMFVALLPFILARSIFRYINHVGALQQLAGLLSGAIAVAFIGLVAFFVAHYISAITIFPEATVRSVVDSILQAPTSVNADMAVWAGFGIVILVGLAAFMAGYKADDPYPGFGVRQRTFYRTRAERERSIKQMRKRINQVIDKAESEAAKMHRRVKTKIRQFSKTVDESKRVSAAYGDYNLALEDVCNIVLGRYRAANAEARQSEMPLSFSEHISFRPDDDQSSPRIADGEIRREQLQDGTPALDAAVAQVRQKLRDLNSRATGSLEVIPGRRESPQEE
jgi:hypothetical protein